jgi:hypothetical protein
MFHFGIVPKWNDSKVLAEEPAESEPALSACVDGSQMNGKGSRHMPATSKAQQKAAGAALSAKRGETKKSELKGASRSMYESMSEKQLEEFAETKRKGLPEKKSD